MAVLYSAVQDSNKYLSKDFVVCNGDRAGNSHDHALELVGKTQIKFLEGKIVNLDIINRLNMQLKCAPSNQQDHLDCLTTSKNHEIYGFKTEVAVIPTGMCLRNSK